MMSSSFAKIMDIERITDVSSVITLKMPDGFQFKGGNWILLNSGFSDSKGNLSKRPYSIMSSDSNGQIIRIAICKISRGGVSEHMIENLERGAELEFGGPYGKNYYIKDADPDGKLLLAATDTGITAMMGILNGNSCQKYLNRILIFWFREDNYEFLSDDYIYRNIPVNISNSFNIVIIPPPDDVGRYQIIRKELTGAILEMTPALSFLSGDGFALRIMREILCIFGMEDEYIRTEPFFNSDMKKIIPKDPAHLRTGYTTGACAAAAAKAATAALLKGKKISRIESTLPNGQNVIFPVKKCEITENRAVCSVIKDAGDDPDCTHLAELTAEVELRNAKGISLLGGK